MSQEWDVKMFLICGLYVFVYALLNHVTQGKADNCNWKNKGKSLVLFRELNFIIGRKMNGFSNTNHFLASYLCSSESSDNWNERQKRIRDLKTWQAEEFATSRGICNSLSLIFFSFDNSQGGQKILEVETSLLSTQNTICWE